MRTAKPGLNRTLHWLIALCVPAALGSGFALTRSPDFVLPILRLHLAFGLSAGLLSLIRVLFWLLIGAPPPVFPAISRLQSLASSLVHGLLRLLPLILLVSGVGMIVLSGASSRLADGSLASLTVFADLPPRNLHHATALFLLLLTGLHGAAALWHWLRHANSA